MNKLEKAREEGRKKWQGVIESFEDTAEGHIIVDALNKTGNVTAAAHELEVDPAYLKKRMNELAVRAIYGIRKGDR